MGNRKQPAEAGTGRKDPAEASAAESEDFFSRIEREVRERCEAKRLKKIADDEAAWAELRAAVARGEITREEILAEYQAQPIRLTIGTDSLEVRIQATATPAVDPELPSDKVRPIRQK